MKTAEEFRSELIEKCVAPQFEYCGLPGVAERVLGESARSDHSFRVEYTEMYSTFKTLVMGVTSEASAWDATKMVPKRPIYVVAPRPWNDWQKLSNAMITLARLHRGVADEKEVNSALQEFQSM